MPPDQYSRTRDAQARLAAAHDRLTKAQAAVAEAEAGQDPRANVTDPDSLILELGYFSIIG